jgi:hypothetical protein
MKLTDDGQWEKNTQGVAQAYFGTVVPNFPNVQLSPIHSTLAF